MKDAQNTLKKKLHSDTICTYIVTAMLAVCAVFKLLTFFIALDNVRIAGAEYTGTAPSAVLKDVLLFVFLTVVVLLLSLILSEIHKTAKPFSKKIINKLRAMAFILIFSSVIPNITAIASDFIDPTALRSSYKFGADSMSLVIFGVVVGLISEIFKYGYELQDNMDSIA